MKAFYLTIGLIWISTYLGVAQQSKGLHLKDSPVTVFSAGSDDYTCFRIPAIIKCGNGDLIAFAEGRKNGCSDTGDIDLVMKRSTDQGKSWGPLKIIWDDGENTCGNPAPVLEVSTDKIILLSTWNLGADKEPQIIDQRSKDTRRIFVISTKNQGEQWTKPKEITKDVKLPGWTWYATGPGSGIQLTQGKHAGRLVIGCDHIEAGSMKYFSHAIYSDNKGRTWKLGGSSPTDKVNECEIAELEDGRLMMNMRNYDRVKKNRQTMISHDAGLSWIDQKHDEALIEPICQASLHGHGQNLLFSNPASTDKRERMTLRLSRDQGSSWTQNLVLHAGPAAYSDLVTIDQNLVGCLFEAGMESAYEQIVFRQIKIELGPP